MSNNQSIRIKILKILRDYYNQNLDRYVTIREIGNQLGGSFSYSDLEEHLKQFAKDSLIFLQVDGNMNYSGKINYNGLEELEKLESNLKSTEKLPAVSNELEPLDLEVSKDDFPWNMKVFISHKFVTNDKELASTLKSILREKEILGYLAENKKEYALQIDEKIQNEIRKSQFLIAVITSESLNSASVNQEIGFALGHGVPVAIMIEKGLIPEGVFTKGRDTEEFTRKNFATHCENITQYVLDYVHGNKNSKKISKTDKEWLIENVYTGLYNALMNVYQRRSFLEEIPPNLWNDLPPATRLRVVEPEIEEVFEEYSREREKWWAIFIEWGNDFTRQITELARIIAPAFEQAHLLNPNGTIRLPKDQNIGLDSWLDMFKFVLLDPSVNNLAILIEKLLKLAPLKGIWVEKSIHYFNTNTDLFRYLTRLLPALRDAFKTEVDYGELTKQRQVMISSIEKVKTALEDKLKGN